MENQKRTDFEQSEKSYYGQRQEKAVASYFDVGWKSQEAQYARFRQFEQLFRNDKQFSINDLGCGNSELHLFLKTEYPEKQATYRGYDHLEAMIEAGAKRFPDIVSNLHVISDASDMVLADYTVASGIFNLKFETESGTWREHILETIDKMAEKSKRGFAFNALTSYSDKEFMRPELFYSEPEWLFGHCMRKYGREVALLHDYGQFDFTISVSKA
jgi:hypothetical protein